MKLLERLGPLAGRILIMLIFLIAGVPKLTSPAQTAGYIASKGLPLASALAIAAGIVELVCGVLIVVGWKARWAALVLAAFLVPVTAIFHNPAGLSGMEGQTQMVMLLKNLAIIGGLLAIAAHGPGPISLDQRARGRAERAG